ncbi:Ionotropic receptor 606 [Blattella germanica]|nr:Ionotropic receptor 606 [Blattella germanica]
MIRSTVVALLIALTVSADNGLLNSQQTNFISCLQEILKKHFSSTMPILVSFRSSCPLDVSRNLNTSSSVQDPLNVVNAVLKNINNLTTVLVTHATTTAPMDFQEDGVLHQGYFVFLSTCEGSKVDEEGDVDDEDREDYEQDLVEALEIQFLKIMDSKSWNPRAKYVIIVLDNTGMDTESIVLELVKSFWSLARMENFILIIRNLEGDHQYDLQENAVLNLYSWFPYINGTCSEVDKVMLLDQWVSSNGGHFSKKLDLFSYKLPRNFGSCQFVISTIGPEPYVKVARNYTDGNENQVYAVEGTGVNLINLFAKDHNFSISYRPPITNFDIDEIIEESMLALGGSSDILCGYVPLAPAVVDFGDVTFPIAFEAVVWIVPCPKPLGRIRRVVGIFTASVWATIILVIIFSSYVLFLQGRNYLKESFGFKNFSRCLSGTWAVLLGVSVPELPLTHNTRSFFLLYVWYSMAISMVFQAFFVTYLVEPGYGERMSSLDDLRRSNVPYVSIEIVDILLSQSSYTGHLLIPKYEGNIEFIDCIKDIMFHRNASTIVAVTYAYFVAEKNGVSEVDKVVCFLDERLFYGPFSMALVKGNPLVPLLNEYFMRCFEAGIQESYKSMFKYKTRLNAEDLYDEMEMYFVFSMQHLYPVFLLLIFGCIVSSITFVVELCSHTLHVCFHNNLLMNCKSM